MQAVQAHLKDIEKRINNILAAMEGGSFSKAVSSRLTTLETEQSRLEKQLKTLRRVKPNITASRVEYMLSTMCRNPAEQQPDHLKRLLQVFVERIDLSEETMSITYTLTKKSAVPTSTADNPTVKTLHYIDIKQCSTIACYGGAVPLPVEHRSKVVPITFAVVSGNSFIVTFEVSA